MQKNQNGVKCRKKKTLYGERGYGGKTGGQMWDYVSKCAT